MVYHQLGRNQRVDLARVTAEAGHRIAHRHQVDHTRDAGEVLHQHPRRRELDFTTVLGLRIPCGQCRDLARAHQHAILAAQQILQQNLQAVRQPLGALNRVEPKDVVARLADGQPTTGPETVR